MQGACISGQLSIGTQYKRVQRFAQALASGRQRSLLERIPT